MKPDAREHHTTTGVAPRPDASGSVDGPFPRARVGRRLSHKVAKTAWVRSGGTSALILVSNAKAKRELGWTLRYPSWRDGFVAAYAPTGSGMRKSSMQRPVDSGQDHLVQRFDQAAAALLAFEDVSARIRSRLNDYREALTTEEVSGHPDISAVSDGEMEERAHAASEGVFATALTDD